MKSLFLLILLCLLGNYSQSQETTYYDCKLQQLDWGGENKLPAGEPFKFRVIDAPYYKTTGGKKDSIIDMKLTIFMSQTERDANNKIVIDSKKTIVDQYHFKNLPDTLSTFYSNIGTSLAFRRYYFLTLEITYSSSSKEELFTELKVYTGIKETKTSRFGAYASLNAVGFWPKDFSEFYANPGFTTGVKIHFTKVIKDENIYRYTLNRFLSRCSFVIGATINDIYYKSTEIKPLILGLKPVVGFDFEVNQHLGFTLGAVFGKQETNSSFTDRQEFVTGAFLGISLSTDIISELSKQTSNPGLKQQD